MKRFAAITIVSLFAAFGCVSDPDGAPSPIDPVNPSGPTSVLDSSPDALEAAVRLTDAVRRGDTSALEEVESDGNVAYIIRLKPVVITCDSGCISVCDLR